jgi:uncharacterized protein YggE
MCVKQLGRTNGAKSAGNKYEGGLLVMRYTFSKYVLSAFLVLGLVVFLTADARVALAQEASQRVISVTGQAEIYVKPDVAMISFGVETNGATAREAQQLNAAAMNKVIDALAAQGIAKEDIQTSNFSLYPVYETQPVLDRLPGRQVLSGYRCNNTVNVRIKDIGNVGGIIDVAIEAGATNVSNITFGVLDSKKYEDEVLAKAVANAKHKAEILAKAAGVNITGILKISDGHVSVSTIRGAYRLADLAAESSPIEPGEVSIVGTVRIDFAF